MHPKAEAFIHSGLYDGIGSFVELEQRISALGAENTKAVGDAFEIFVEGYLATQQKMLCEKVWLVGQLPADTRKRLNLPNDPKGIDGVFRTRTGTEVPYQVKYRSQRAYLTYTELAPFLGLTERGISDRIVFTNSNELADDVKNRDGMRTVRGIDFDDLTKEELDAISCWLRGRPAKIAKLDPYSYQLDALTQIHETLKTHDRAHVVMACGTGKTLVALWAAEALKPKTVLVLLPSLTLLQQTLGEWSKHNNWGEEFAYLCVCSDPTVTKKDENDPITLNATDLDFRVDTSPDEVRRFIMSDTPNIKVVFSTYQSSPVISEAMRRLAPFDVGIFDEAHKTTGPQGGLFAHALMDTNISIRKRLFFTATPRHYDIRHRDREGDFRMVSMDDESIYGPRAYTLTFGAAAKQGIICNYKVVISVVDGQEISDFALKHGITLVEGDRIGAKWVANQIAIERAIEKTHAKRAITFHSRVSSAKEFSSDGTHGIKQFLSGFSVFHVNGSQNSAERKTLIRDFRSASKALITNARCLTEGIDVPAVDMVAFVDPRQSKIDIAQATGRAMRKPRGSDKTTGYIVVPLFLKTTSGEPIAAALARSEFSEVANVLNAMQEQDEDLVQIIRDLKEEKGQGKVFDPRQLSEKIEVFGPSIELSALRSGIFAEIVDEIGVSWDEWYGRLKVYKDREGHCRVPATHKENGFNLGSWAQYQRRAKENLSPERIQRLDELGFVWEPFGDDWEQGFNYLKSFHKREGHCRVPQGYKESGFSLFIWVCSQRTKKAVLSTERIRRLDELGFVWDMLEFNWNEGFRYLKSFHEREGHCRVLSGYKENGFNLGEWTSRQRRGKEVLSADRFERLNELGFVWDVLETAWEKGFSSLKNFYEREGHCRVLSGYKENEFNLGNWVSNQRSKKQGLSAERLKRLNELGFVWDTNETAWEEGFSSLKLFRERERHCRVLSGYKENEFNLGNWVSSQRQSKETLSPERLLRLNDLGFVWEVLETNWDQGFGYLKIFSEREGHCRVSQGHKENGFSLGIWVGTQRTRKQGLSAERLKRLNELGFVWDTNETAWEEGFSSLKTFHEREGHCRVSREQKENGFNLGSWAHHQRRTKEKLSQERQLRLNALGFVWDVPDAAWDKGFSCLKSFYEREGHCRVVSGYKENGFNLGKWMSHQRTNQKRLSAERLKRLNELGFVWDTNETAWEEGFSSLKLFREREGHSRVPKRHEEDGFNLGTWLGTQRSNKESLSAERTQRLNELGFVWDTNETAWEEGFSSLKTFHEREGHCHAPNGHKEDGFNLGAWVRNLRTNQKRLSAERLKRLNELGFVWDVPDAAWDKGFSCLKSFHEREGHCHAPKGHKESGFNLGTWAQYQRSNKETLSAERLMRLNDLGFVWEVHETNWEKGFSHLKNFHEREGHCRVSQAYKENGFDLGRWVSQQRMRYKNLSPDRIRRLNDLDFIWDGIETKWDQGFGYLKIFHEREGHCRVSQAYKENGYKLGVWVSVQRIKKEKLSAERLRRLNDLGFVWDARLTIR
jgi:superfamily II DNA or RNA helicase